MSPKAFSLLVIVLNLLVFGIMEVFLLSYPLMTPLAIFTHVGFVMNIVLLIVAVAVRPGRVAAG